jgi:hypothetical protein
VPRCYFLYKNHTSPSLLASNNGVVPISLPFRSFIQYPRYETGYEAKRKVENGVPHAGNGPKSDKGEGQ